MANPEHVAVARRGAGPIRAWRMQHPGDPVDFDLSGADLRGAQLYMAELSEADLSGADLLQAELSGANLSGSLIRGANLRGTDMRWVNLRRADLSEADLSGATMEEADLRGAILTRAVLIEANLQGVNMKQQVPFPAELRALKGELGRTVLTEANLIGADLLQADLGGAILRGADMCRCSFGWTAIGGVDLSSAEGLRLVKHVAPSTIGTDTLALSKGRIPDVFLRGCGLSDWEMEAAKLHDPELLPNQIIDIQQRVFELRAGSAIQIGALFISYTHTDGEFVDALEGKLNKAGIRFWRDVHHATAGPLDSIVDRAMRLNPTVLLVLSERSVESDWVEDEAKRAREIEKDLGRHVLCPIALDDAWKQCKWSRPLRTQIEKYNVLSFNSWKDPAALEEMFRRLVDGLSIFYQPENAGR